MAFDRIAIFFIVANGLVACGATAAGSATLSWSPSTRNTDGSPISNLAGYEIHYGSSPKALNMHIRINDPRATTYVIRSLSPGTYYFGVTAYSATGEQSSLSALASKTIP